MGRNRWAALALVWGVLAVPGSANETGRSGEAARGTWWQRLPATVRRLVDRRTNGDILSPPNTGPAREVERQCGKRSTCG
jgi:hypothetical protein